MIELPFLPIPPISGEVRWGVNVFIEPMFLETHLQIYFD